MNTDKLILSMCLLSATLSLPAQSIQLTLEACHDMALKQNHSILNAQLDEKAARLQKREAAAEYFPSVSAMGFSFHAFNPLINIDVIDVLGNNDYAHNLQETVDSYGSTYGIHTEYTALQKGYSASLTLLQPLYAGGRIVTGNRLASLGIEAAAVQRSLQQRKTSAEVDEMWWQIVSLEEKMETVTELEQTLDTLYKNIESAIASGLAASTDILQVQLKQNELRSAKKQLEGGIRLMKMNLFNAIGQPYMVYSSDKSSSTPYIDSITLLYLQTMPQTPEDYYRKEDEIVANMDESKLLDLQVRAKTLEKRMTVGEMLPQLAVGATYSYSDLLNKGQTNGIAFATLQIPLSDYGKKTLKAKRIETQVQKAENDKEYLEKQLRLQVRKFFLDLTTSYDGWQVAQEAMATARKLFDVAESNYENGMIPLQDYLQAETEFRAAKNNATDALIAYRNAIRAYCEIGRTD